VEEVIVLFGQQDLLLVRRLLLQLLQPGLLHDGLEVGLEVPWLKGVQNGNEEVSGHLALLRVNKGVIAVSADLAGHLLEIVVGQVSPDILVLAYHVLQQILYREGLQLG
jgi:hypothetical protein